MVNDKTEYANTYQPCKKKLIYGAQNGLVNYCDWN